MSEESDLRLRARFLAIEEEDQAALAELQPLFEKHADALVGAFYRHLLAFEPTRELLSDPKVKESLLAKQRAYLLSLAPADLDGAYLEGRRKIGETHERIHLEPRWYLGAYALYQSLLIPLICEQYAGRPAQAERALSALLKVLSFDAQVAMEAYIERRERELEYLTRELAASSRELERSYRAQAHELRNTEARARVAEEMASVGTLVAGLAHEIGTPMGVIQGHAELLERSVQDERGRWRLRTIREQIERIAGIIKTLLHLARPKPVELTSIDLLETVQVALDFMSERFERRKIRVVTDFRVHPHVQGDRDRLQQVWLNLLMNAVDAMPRGGKLTVRLEEIEGPRVRVSVADEGQGIDPAALERVFEPFFTTKGPGSGNGLGLMVARTIVEEHGGQLTAHSDGASGAEFQIELPLDSNLGRQ